MTRTSNLSMHLGLLIASLSRLLLMKGNSAVAAFGVPQTFASSRVANAAVLASANLSPSGTGLWDGSTAPEAGTWSHSSISMFSFLISEDAIDIIRNIAVAVTAVVFLFAGITLLTASVLIPAAAKELEKECLELAPDLWDEYQAKLEPGQTIDKRPELMQELGNKLQPLLDAKIARAQRGEDTTPSNTGQWDDTASSFVDAEIVSEDKTDNDKPKP